MRVRLCGFGLGVDHSLLLGGTDFDTVSTRESNYTQPVLVCQGDLALFEGQFRRVFALFWGFWKGPFCKGFGIIRKWLGVVKGIIHICSSPRSTATPKALGHSGIAA